ncbi:MAG: T9SS type A sorting domain-containing protein [bacterium]
MKNYIRAFILFVGISGLSSTLHATRITPVDGSTYTNYAHHVIATYNSYGLTEYIHLQSAIGAAGYIDTIWFECQNNPTSPLSDIVIYLGNTSKTTFTSTSDWITSGNLTQVYSGSVSLASGWNAIVLQTPFYYNNDSNLVVMIDNNHGSIPATKPFWYYASSTNRHIYKTSYSNIDPTNPGTASGYNSEISSFRINVTPPYIHVTYPNASGISLSRGEQYNITWTSLGVERVKIDLYRGANPDAQHSIIVAGTSASSGSYSWTISSDQAPRTDYKVKISDSTSGSPNDMSDNTFTILGYTNTGGGTHELDGSSQSWTISANTDIAGEHTAITTFAVDAGITAKVKDYDSTHSTYGGLSVTSNTMNINGTLSANASGFRNNDTKTSTINPGRGDNGTGNSVGAGGGGFGGLGGHGTSVFETYFANGGYPYGDSIPDKLGSSGGNCGIDGIGGAGGGKIKLTCTGTLTLGNNGIISANGNDGTSLSDDAGAGGSGGSINIGTGTLTGSSANCKITADGGNGSYDSPSFAGGGAGGKVLIKFEDIGGTSFYGKISASGGTAEGYACDGSPGLIRIRQTGSTTSTLNITLSPVVDTTNPDNGAEYIFAHFTDRNVSLLSGSSDKIVGNIDIWTVGNILIENSSGNEIDASGKGWGSHQGPNTGNSGVSGSGGGAAGYGGSGGQGNQGASGGSSDTTAPCSPDKIGSGGGNAFGDGIAYYCGGSGGGRVMLYSLDGTITIKGNISVDGSNGRVGGNMGDYAGAGGAGGSVFIKAPTIIGGIAGLNGSISAKGGNGIQDGLAYSGGAGGGRVAVIYKGSYPNYFDVYVDGGTKGGGNAQDGSAGTRAASKAPEGWAECDTFMMPSWRVKLKATGSFVGDTLNYAGAETDAKDTFDLDYDFPKPPAPPSNYMQLYFPHSEWNHNLGEKFKTDIRENTNLTDTFKIWNVYVKTDHDSDTVRIDATLLDVPTSYNVYLYDTLIDSLQDMRKTPIYIYNAISDTGGLHRLQLVIGRSIEGELYFSNWNKDKSSYFSLLQYPNPFTNSTMIKFHVPAGKLATLTVYDLSGRVIKKYRDLTNEHSPISLNAKNYPSGVYFLKLNAGEQKIVKKLVLIQ